MQKPKEQPLQLVSILNCAEIARRIGKTQQYVYMLLTGQRTSTKRMSEIQDLLGKELAPLLKKAKRAA
jgi:hypothetical protein